MCCPTFKRSEKWEANGSALRGADGPLSVSSKSITREVVDKWLEAAVNAGYPETPDYNAEDQEGVSYFQFTRAQRAALFQRSGLSASG